MSHFVSLRGGRLLLPRQSNTRSWIAWTYQGKTTMVTCWKCNRNLGPMLEHQKMVTERGPICYACFNAIQEEGYQAERVGPADQPKSSTPGNN